MNAHGAISTDILHFRARVPVMPAKGLVTGRTGQPCFVSRDRPRLVVPPRMRAAAAPALETAQTRGTAMQKVRYALDTARVGNVTRRVATLSRYSPTRQWIARLFAPLSRRRNWLGTAGLPASASRFRRGAWQSSTRIGRQGVRK